MALDGFTIYKLVEEFRETLLNGRIDKIMQPEPDEIIIPIRNNSKNYKLLLTASPSNPRVHLINYNKENPAQAPMFCMLLRKHLSNGKIIDIVQPQFERIIEFHIESMNELGDWCTKKLLIEVMGRHSNIILINEENKILDSIKHVNSQTSRVREVLPGRSYESPPSQNKKNPLTLSKEEFLFLAKEAQSGVEIGKFLFKNLMGFSQILVREVCYRLNLFEDEWVSALTLEQLERIYEMINSILITPIAPYLYYENQEIIDFSPMDMVVYNSRTKVDAPSISQAIDTFYYTKDKQFRLKQKSAAISKLVQMHLDRLYKKKSVLYQELEDVADRELYKIYGDLIVSNIYHLSLGQTLFRTANYYSENYDEVEIPLERTKTPSENAQRYYKKYVKAKNTFKMAHEQLELAEEDIRYLESLIHAISHVDTEADIEEIRDELVEAGYLQKRKGTKKGKVKPKQNSQYVHYVSSDGFHIYVGRNNKQNDELTFKFARAEDIWLHVKDIPGSHVIIKTDRKEVSNDVIEIAANIAAYYSKGKTSSKVPVDYTQRKNVKKPNGAKPGMVIYEQYNTVVVTPNEQEIASHTQLQS